MSVTMHQLLRLVAVAAVFFTSPASAELTICPNSDWILFDSACYWRSTFQLSWDKITDVCASLAPGALPTSVHTFTEDALIAETLMGGEKAWLGLKRSNTVGSYSYDWVDGSEYNRYFFGCNEPSYDGEACAVINHGRIGAWALFSCDDLQYFVCRVPARSA